MKRLICKLRHGKKALLHLPYHEWTQEAKDRFKVYFWFFEAECQKCGLRSWHTSLEDHRNIRYKQRPHGGGTYA